MATAGCTIPWAAATISPPAASGSWATPRQRIAEDYLRILRFFRFHARFGRGPADAAALAACAELEDGIDRLSGERVRQELWRILAGPRVISTLQLMQATGVLDRAVPGNASLPVLERLIARLSGGGPAAARCRTDPAGGRRRRRPPC